MERSALEGILALYNLGTVRGMTRMENGFSSLNYKVEYAEKNYLLKVVKSRTLEDIQYELSLVLNLSKRGFQVAKPLANQQGHYYTKTTIGYACLLEFIEGTLPELNPKTVSAIATEVAALNSIADWQDLGRKNNLGIDYCLALAERLPNTLGDSPIVRSFVEHSHRLAPALQAALPRGFIHGDLFPDNTIFEGDELVAVLDFECACIDNLLIDVGMTITGFCFVGEELDDDLMKSFLDAYQKVRKLTAQELELLPFYIEWGTHLWLGWHLEEIEKFDLQKNKDRVKIHDKRALSMRKKFENWSYSQMK